MRLYELKSKYISKLALYESKNDREKQLKDLVINKLYNIRSMTLPYLVHTLYEIIEHERDVSSEFKEICKQMLQDVQKLEGEDQ